jgi:hypothetical protein
VVEWTDSDGQKHSGPAVVGKQYTLSLNEKANLRADLEAWRGRTFTDQELAGFDVKQVLGKSCQLGIVHNANNGKTYANVKAVMGLPKGAPKPVASGPLIHYDIDNHNQEIFDKLPGWLQTAISDRIVLDEPAPSSTPSDPEFDDALPF